MAGSRGLSVPDGVMAVVVLVAEVEEIDTEVDKE